jgi:ribosome biogenesis GTPase
MGRPRKAPREKDLTSRFLSGGLDEDRVEGQQRFSSRNKNAAQEKMLKTFLMRAEELAASDVEALPVGQVVQVFSLFCEVEHGGRTYLCVVRKTLTKVSDTNLVVGDRVRFRVIEMLGGTTDADGTHRASAGQTREPEAVIEQVLPRQTVLTRTDSFKGVEQHPIVANADQMLIVASLRHPTVKWGLIDRMIVAARGGGLRPVVCLNKIDLALAADGSPEAQDLVFARQVLSHYASLGIDSFQASAERGVGLDELRAVLRDRTTVLAGHSGVGKSSLVRAIQPQLDLKVGEISRYTDKGRHTTTSARRYQLDFGGEVIDTPGVKHFGLWGVTQENLLEHFPDVAAGTAPDWRRESYERILSSIPSE